MLTRHGIVEHFETWPHGAVDWDYQYAILRV
jgi:hypothetical protein